MRPDELRRMAMRQSADYDAKTPGRLSCQPLAITVALAYPVQAEVGRLRERRGERIIGYKVGCTSKPIQEQLRMQEPIFGRIFDTGCFRSGASLSQRSHAPRACPGWWGRICYQSRPGCQLATSYQPSRLGPPEFGFDKYQPWLGNYRRLHRGNPRSSLYPCCKAMRKGRESK